MKGCSCNSNRIIAVVKDDRILRLTYSESLAQLCSSKISGSSVCAFDVSVGEELVSPPDYNCLFAIVSNKNQERVLRGALSWEEAKLLSGPSRSIRAMWLLWNKEGCP